VTEAVEIEGQDQLHGGGRDPQLGETRGARSHDIVALEHAQLVAGDKRVRQALEHQRIERGKPEGDRDEQALPPPKSSLAASQTTPDRISPISMVVTDAYNARTGRSLKPAKRGPKPAKRDSVMVEMFRALSP